MGGMMDSSMRKKGNESGSGNGSGRNGVVYDYIFDKVV